MFMVQIDSHFLCLIEASIAEGGNASQNWLHYKVRVHWSGSKHLGSVGLTCCIMVSGISHVKTFRMNIHKIIVHINGICE